MSKPKEIKVEGKKYFAWPYEEQTQIKHKVLESYLKIWIAKLGKFKNTIFFDCHGGCGAYLEENGQLSFGSSIRIKNIASEINKNRKTKTGVYYCEIESKYYRNYLEVIKDNGSPKILTYNKSFEDVIKDVNIKKYYNNYPTLFFVDPFGYNFKISELSPMMKGYGNEIIINFMFDFINRFLSIDNLEKRYNDFFGTNEWQLAKNMKEQEREEFLIGIFKNKIKEITGAKFVFAYRLCFPNKNQTYYYLVHATNHIDGITFMKTAFASVNNGRVQYLGKKNNDFTFWDLDYFKATEIYESNLKELSEKELTFEKLWYQIVENTAYTSKDLSQALIELESLKKVSITRVSSKRGSYKEKDIIKIL